MMAVLAQGKSGQRRRGIGKGLVIGGGISDSFIWLLVGVIAATISFKTKNSFQLLDINSPISLAFNNLY